MNQVKEVYPQNSLVMLFEKNHGRLPDDIGDAVITATPSFISIGTYPVTDGPTKITLTDDREWPLSNPDMIVLFRGTIETPGRTLQLLSVLDEEIFNIKVRQALTLLEILGNDDFAPNKICIILE